MHFSKAYFILAKVNATVGSPLNKNYSELL